MLSFVMVLAARGAAHSRRGSEQQGEKESEEAAEGIERAHI